MLSVTEISCKAQTGNVETVKQHERRIVSISTRHVRCCLFHLRRHQNCSFPRLCPDVDAVVRTVVGNSPVLPVFAHTGPALSVGSAAAAANIHKLYI